ncbi:MAG: hypothetical protein Kow00122_13530 [Thermoleophilia bacterium]
MTEGGPSRFQRRLLAGLAGLVAAAVVIVLVAQIFTGCWIDVGNEMGDQPNVGFVESPRSAAPAEAVPFAGPDFIPSAGVPANPVTPSAASVARGEALFAVFCAPCHGQPVGEPATPGPVGQLFAPPPPHLEQPIAVRRDGELWLTVTQGFGRMPALASRMSVEDRWDLVNYLRSLVGGVPIPAAEPVLLRGARLFSVQCASCHGPTGGGALGPALRPSSFLAEAGLEEVVAFLQAGRPGRGMPSFAGRLAEEDFPALFALLKALQTQGPAVLEESLQRLRETTTTTTAGPPTTAGGTAPTAGPPTTATTGTAPPTGPGTTTGTSAGNPALVARGLEVFDANCRACHGAAGSGGIGPRLKPNDFVGGSPESAVRSLIENGRAGTAMPAWKGRLSPAEIDAVTALLKSWQAPPPAGAAAAQAAPATLPFTHRAHAGKGITCLFCHSSARRGPAADLPPLQLCADCHRWLSTQNEQTKAVVETFTAGKEIGWPRVYDLPDFVFFNHQMHVVVGRVDCSACHGDVAGMTLATRAKRLTMGFCLDCHKRGDARLIDCDVCHE